MRESIWESRDGLDGRERKLSNIVGFFETKDAFDLGVVDVFLDTNDIRVHMLNVVNIWEDEGLFRVEAESKNVFDIVFSHLDGTFGTIKLNLRLVDILLIVGDLNDEGHVEDALQPLSEDEGDAMAHVKCVSRWTTTRVQVEGLAVFVCIEDLLDVSLAEEDATSDKPMGLFPNSSFQSLNEFRSDWEAAVFLNQLIIIDTCVILCSDFKWCYNVIIIRLFWRCNFCFFDHSKMFCSVLFWFN